jgi:hypothetical protein
LGAQPVMHWPDALQVPVAQVPHETPHTGSGPQLRPAQSGVQPFGTHCPFEQ